MGGISFTLCLLADPVLSMDDRFFFWSEHQFNTELHISSFEEVILPVRAFPLHEPVLDPYTERLLGCGIRYGSSLSQTSAADLFSIFKFLSGFIRDSEMSKIKVLDRPSRSLIF